jgi:DNA polymerase I
MTETLYLVDGSGYIFRAYYAIRPLTNSQGLPTNAIYGFTTMLLKLIREKKPDHIAVAFDVARKTFRNEAYPDYKANRSEPPEDLVPQFPYFRKVVEALNIPCLELQNYEADDVIATIAHDLKKKKINTVVVTGDKDLMQLVNDQITLLDTMKNREIGLAEVKDKFGVTPEQVPDVLGLAGDSSDNIPGVPGVGDKTAKKLIQEYGSIEELLKSADKVKGKLGERLRDNQDMALLCKRLATVKDDVPLDYSWDDFKLSEPDPEKLRTLLQELEFHSLITELAPQKTLSSRDYHLVTSEEALRDMVKDLKTKGAYAIDTETTGLNVLQDHLVGVAFSGEVGKAYYVPVAHQTMEQQLNPKIVAKILRPFLERKDISQYGQNIKYDWQILKQHGYELGAVVFDTMVAAYCVNPSGRHSLDSLAMAYLGHKTIGFKEIVGTGKKQKKFSEIDLETACEYAAEDADVTFRLAAILEKQIDEKKARKVFYEIEMPLVSVLMQMELDGIRVDSAQLEKLSNEYKKKITSLEKKIFKEADQEFNLNSPKQLGKVLFEDLEIPAVRKTKTGYSTDVEVLEALAEDYVIADYLLEYRALTKLKSTYVDALPRLIDPQTKRIHTSFNQTVAASGRLSSSNPNLQNIPIRSEEGRRIREAFVADTDCVLLAADYSQIELRLLAHVSQDKILLAAFKDDQDIHAITASRIFGIDEDKVSHEQRNVGKTVNFSVLYGQTAYGLSGQLGIEAGEAKQYIDNYFQVHEGVTAYKEEALRDLEKNEYVETLFGRRRYFPGLAQSNHIARSNMERMAFNTIFQGTAADIIKLAMLSLSENLLQKNLKSRMILQVHDELIFDVNNNELNQMKELVMKKMEGAAKLSVPLKIHLGIGPNWAAAKS